MIPALLSWLNDRTGEAEPGPPRLVGGIVCGIYRASPKVALILFDAFGEPAAVVKVAREGSAEPAVMAEHAALLRLQERPDFERRQAPRALALGRVSGRLALATSHLPGAPMTARYYSPGHTRAESRVRSDFAVAARWLEHLQRDSAGDEVVLDQDVVDQHVWSVVDRYRREIGWSPEEQELFDAVARRARDLYGTAVPLVDVHGDFWMGNLLVERDEITGVVDWELSHPGGLPFSDIFKFPTSYASYLDRAYPGAAHVPGHPGWRRARDHWARFGTWPNLAGLGYGYFGDGWFPDIVHRFVRERLTELNVPVALTAVFFPVFLAQQALTLDDPSFRNGYRSALLGFARDRDGTWLWNEAPRPSAALREAVPR